MERLRGKVPVLPGARMERGYRLVGLLLGLLGITLGGAAASAALAYDGSTPVNVFGFLAGLVLLQVVLLAAMILIMVFRRAAGTGMVMGWAQGLVVWMSRARWVDRMLRSIPEETTASVQAFQSRRSLYGGAERWLLFTLTQRFGALFNASALVTCLLLVTFTDLAFSWSTTLSLDAGDVRSTLEWIALPWSWAVTDAVPSGEVIARSRWVRSATGGDFISGGSLAEIQSWAGAWWRFLVAALCFWGLLPRVVGCIVGRHMTAKALASVTLDHGAFQRLYERLIPVGATWTGPAPDDVGTEDVAELADEGVPKPSETRKRTPRPRSRAPRESIPARTGSAVVLWGSLLRASDILRPLVAARFSDTVTSLGGAGGADLADDRATIDAIGAGSPARVVMVVEAGVQPTKEIFGFLRDLRDAAGARAQLVVALVQPSDGGWAGPDDAERTAWRVRIDGWGDPYLRYEDLVEGS